MQLPCTWLYPSAICQIRFSCCKGNGKFCNHQTFWCLFPIISVSAMSKNASASGESNLFELFRALSSSRRSLRERFSEWRVELVRTLPSVEFFEAKPQRTRLSFLLPEGESNPFWLLGLKSHKGSVPVCHYDSGTAFATSVQSSTVTLTNLISQPSRMGSRFSSVEATFFSK